MQATAYDQEGRPTFVDDAFEGRDYSCICCGNSVRKTHTPHLRDHFYHLEKSSLCLFSNRSQADFSLALKIFSILPKGEANLETMFKKIGIGGDVTWNRHQILYKILSPSLSPEEMKKQTTAFLSIGWKAVWILQTKFFFEKKPSKLEILLEDIPHYYSNHDEKGDGSFFDCDWNFPFRRVICHGVKLNQPLLIPFLDGPRSKRTLFFKGDLFDLSLKGKFRFTPPIGRERFSDKMVRWCRGLWHLLLEKTFL